MPADLLLPYLDQLAYPPYPVQERALEAWFDPAAHGARDGVLLSAPTGTGKTLVAEAACFEALHTRRRCYYTTPLIALTDQKFKELQDQAEKWGFAREDVGLVTGNRTVNPRARVLVVVAEILLNRLLHRGQEDDFADTAAVVMDEFHWFSEPDRGSVWELSLALLPKHVRVLLLSATVGNAYPFCSWLQRTREREVALVSATERRVPLHFEFVADEYLPDQLERMAKMERVPALVFCFDREGCWDAAELLRGKDLLTEEQAERLHERLEAVDLHGGIGPKLRRLLQRGVGVHHAGLLPRHRRLVEALYLDKLLPACVCTETLAAGINLPARAVVLTGLVKGPRGKRKLIEPSAAQQMFGRAGRPQFDSEGFVYALAHEDDVAIARHMAKVNQIPEDAKDPVLMKKRKELLKKCPKRRDGEAYWNEAQFLKLRDAEPGKLESRGRLPWRLLAYTLDASPKEGLDLLRTTVKNRLLPDHLLRAAQEDLTRMLTTLHHGGFLTLAPPPPAPATAAGNAALQCGPGDAGLQAGPQEPSLPAFTFGTGISMSPKKPAAASKPTPPAKPVGKAALECGVPAVYEPLAAAPTRRLPELLRFRAAHPLFSAWILPRLREAEPLETLQILESLLEFPPNLARQMRPPQPSRLAPGPLATGWLDPQILTRGLLSAGELYPEPPNPDDPPELRRYAPPLAAKAELLFHAENAHASDLRIVPVWVAAPLIHDFHGDFAKLVSSYEMARQEGLLFRHFMRMILLCEEFAEAAPQDEAWDPWVDQLDDWMDLLTDSCRRMDPECTDNLLDEAHAARAEASPTHVRRKPPTTPQP